MTTISPEHTIESQTHETGPLHEPGDHERLSHYAERHKVTQAMVEGTAITALCGKTWVPTRDPKKFPICPECQEIWNAMPPGD